MTVMGFCSQAKACVELVANTPNVTSVLPQILVVIRAVAASTSYQVSHFHRKVHVRLPGKGNSKSHGARPIHLITTMMKWIRISRWSISISLSFSA